MRRQQPDVAEVVDVGCGRGTDAYWFAASGVPAVGLDYSPRGAERLAAQAAEAGVPATYHAFNLLELRSGARLGRPAGATSRRPATAPVRSLARHLVDATDPTGRRHLWRFAQMALRGGGRLYLEFLVPSEGSDRFARKHFLHPLTPEVVISELEARGATVVARQDKTLRPQGPQHPPAAAWSSDLSIGGRMAGMNMRTKVSRGVAKVRDAGSTRVDMIKLAARVKELEAEVQECRQLNLRLAELTDVVQELLLPVAQRDEARITEVMERYTKNLG